LASFRCREGKINEVIRGGREAWGKKIKRGGQILTPQTTVIN